jgi:dihydroxy-acid dehydratase
MVRISDARMSGTAFGTVILHVSPEAAIGGPLALVQTGDRIRLSVSDRSLDLLVDDVELEQRRQRLTIPDLAVARRGYDRLYGEQVMQADEGCDFAMMLPNTPETPTP